MYDSKTRYDNNLNAAFGHSSKMALFDFRDAALNEKARGKIAQLYSELWIVRSVV